MDLNSRIEQYIINEVSDKSSAPESYSVEFSSESVWDVDKNEDLVIVANWTVEAPDDWNVDTKRDKRYIYIQEDCELYSEVIDLLYEQYNNISLKEYDSELSSLSINPTPDYNEYYSPEWSDEIISDLYSIMLCKNYHNIDDKDINLMNDVINHLHNKFNDNISENNIKNIILHFSDFHYNRLSNLKVNIMTSNPHFYYSDVGSLDEYISKASGDKSDLQNQDEYEVFVPVGYSENNKNRRENIPEKLIEVSENLMDYRMNNIIECQSSDCLLEGEAIIIDGESAVSKFWIRRNI